MRKMILAAAKAHQLQRHHASAAHQGRTRRRRARRNTESRFARLPKLPLWMGSTEATGTNESGEETVTLHWHFPFFKGKLVDDPNAKWVPLCIGLHEWTSRCNLGNCATAAQRASGLTSCKYTDDVEIGALLAANGKLNKDGKIGNQSNSTVSGSAAETRSVGELGQC